MEIINCKTKSTSCSALWYCSPEYALWLATMALHVHPYTLSLRVFINSYVLHRLYNIYLMFLYKIQNNMYPLNMYIFIILLKLIWFLFSSQGWDPNHRLFTGGRACTSFSTTTAAGPTTSSGSRSTWKFWRRRSRLHFNSGRSWKRHKCCCDWCNRALSGI